MSVSVEVDSRVLAEGKPKNLLPSVTFVLDLASLSVGELIRIAVNRQVRDLVKGQQADLENARRLLNRQYLSEDDVRRMELSGRVAMPSKRAVDRRQAIAIDPEVEVQRAQAAFEAGTYMVLVNDKAAKKLDEVVSFPFDSKVTFLRLTPLTGG